MNQKFITSSMVLLLSGLALTGCGPAPDKAPEFALLSLFSNKPTAAIENHQNSYVVATSDPAVTGCKINVTTSSAPTTSGSVTPGTALTFEMEGADVAHVENAGFIAGLGNSVGDLPASHSIIAPDVTTKYVLSVFTVDGVRTRNNNCEVTVNVTPTGLETAPLPSCEIKANPVALIYGDPLTVNWTSQNGVTAEVSPTRAVGVVAPADIAAGSWSYKSYYGDSYSMKVWNQDGIWAQCSVNIRHAEYGNISPAASDSAYTIDPSASINGVLRATDLEQHPITYSIKTQPTRGTVTITDASTGAFTYTANSNFYGIDSFTFTANDGNSDSNIATVRIQYNPAIAKQVTTGGLHTCALLESGKVRCWGVNGSGQLGYGNTNHIGDNEIPASAGYVDVGGPVKQIAAGFEHTCALLESGTVRCWGSNNDGQLGYGHTNRIGDNETPAGSGDVDVGGAVKQITAGFWHTCALLDSGKVRCWGYNFGGQLGYGNTETIGDNETPASVDTVNVGGTVKQITTGNVHTCALLDTGKVRCWGVNSDGRLGYGHTTWIGDNEAPASAGDVNVGGTVKQITAGQSHTCALLESGNVRCWGFNHQGQLGYGHTGTIGDNETPASVDTVDVGGTVKQITADGEYTCVLIESGKVRCWGENNSGQLGYGHRNNIGDNEIPASSGDVDVGGTVKQISAGPVGHTCALLESGRVRCWGTNGWGQLGYGNTNNIGDNETPASAGDVNL